MELKNIRPTLRANNRYNRLVITIFPVIRMFSKRKGELIEIKEEFNRREVFIEIM